MCNNNALSDGQGGKPGGSVIYTTAGLSLKQQDAILKILYQWWFLKGGGFAVSCGAGSPVTAVDVSRDVRTTHN